MIGLVNALLWVVLPLAIVAAITIVLFYYTCVMRDKCRITYGSKRKTYIIGFTVIFAITFCFYAIYCFLTWADYLATLQYLWDRVFYPDLLTSLTVAGISVFVCRVLFK